jgi:hypothetical protein
VVIFELIVVAPEAGAMPATKVAKMRMQREQPILIMAFFHFIIRQLLRDTFIPCGTISQ